MAFFLSKKIKPIANDPMGHIINRPPRWIRWRGRLRHTLLGFLIFGLIYLAFMIPRWKDAAYEKQFGLTGRYYQGAKFEKLAHKRIDRVISFNWTGGSPSQKLNSTNFSAKWSGTLRVLESGVYEFEAVFDDRCRVWIDDDLIIEGWGNIYPESIPMAVHLEEGHHPIRIDYSQSIGEANMELRWKPARDWEIDSQPISPAFLRPEQAETDENKGESYGG